MFTRLSLIRAALAVLALATGLTAHLSPAREQPVDSPWLFLSTNDKEPTDKAPLSPIFDKDRHRILLRPNIEETYYVYVHNPTEKDQDLTVAFANGPEDGDEFARATVRVAAGKKTARVRPPVPPPPPPGTKAAPPTNRALPDKIYMRLIAENKTIDIVPLPVTIQVPLQYVAADPAFRGEPNTLANRLDVTVSDRKQDDKPFTGPPAKVSLDLSTARIPELIPESIRDSTLLNTLAPGGTTKLTAANLRFRSPNRSGVFTVGIDGYERAFLFETDFGGNAPQPVKYTMLRLNGPKFAVPGKPCPIKLEVDKPPTSDVVVEFGIDRANSGDFATHAFVGERFQKKEVRWDGVAGGLVFVTDVHDWIEDLDTAGMTGPRKLRLRLLSKTGDVLKKEGKEEPAVVEDVIVLDDTQPEMVKFAPFGKAIRNQMFDVGATGNDPESGIARVLFFLGEPPSPPPENKPVTGGRVALALPPAKPDGAYMAQIPLPDRPGRIPIGVRFFNNAGLWRDVVDEIEVVDPPPKPVTGAIKVTVVQGSPARPQPGLEVQLRDEKNATILKTGKVNEKGEYTFENLPPAKYIVYSTRPSDYTKAQAIAVVEAGKTENVTLSLKR